MFSYVFRVVGFYFAGGGGTGAGGLMMVVLFSTFFSSFPGGAMIVVFFSTTFSGAGVAVRMSHAARRNTELSVMIIGFIFMISDSVSSADAALLYNGRAHDDFGGDHLVAVFCVIDSHGKARLHGLDGDRLTRLVYVSGLLAIAVAQG